MTTLAGFELGSVMLGDLELLRGGEGAFAIEALGSDSGYDLGNADPIEVALQTLLQEGAVVVTQGHNNREVVIPVLVKAGDPVALAEAEQRLFLQLERRNTLTMRYAEYDLSTVFEVVTSSLAQVTDDFAEVKRGERRYNIRLVCEPASRSESLVEVEISAGGEPPASETAVVISEADDLTGWSPRSDETLVDGDGYVAAVNGPSTGNYVGLDYQLPTPASVGTTPYIYVEWATADIDTLVGGLQIRINGINSYRLSPFVSVAAGDYIRSYFNTADYNSVPPGGTVSNIHMDVRAALLSSTPGVGQLRINRIVRTNMAPILGSARQVTAQFPVLGSAPAQGSVRVRHPLTQLGKTLVYTRAASDTYYNPPMREKLVSPKPAETVSSSAVSGKTSDPRVLHIFRVPALSLPEGTYDIWIRARDSNAMEQTFAWTAQHIDPNGDAVGPVESGSHTRAMSGAMDLFNIGQVRLPTVKSRSGAGFVRLEFQQTTNNGAGAPELDELWLFEKQRGALTVVRAGNKRRLWLEAATVDRPRPAIYILDKTNGSVSTGNTADAIYPAGLVDAFGEHRFEPGLMSVFVVSEATGPAVGIDYYPRWHTHAAL